VGLSQLDAGGEVDISEFIADSVGGVELADGLQIGHGPPDLLGELAASDFFGGQARGEATGGDFTIPVIDGILDAIGKVLWA
jgi:hypothetical protein